jgi:hypothetical protein
MEDNIMAVIHQKSGDRHERVDVARRWRRSHQYSHERTLRCSTATDRRGSLIAEGCQPSITRLFALGPLALPLQHSNLAAAAYLGVNVADAFHMAESTGT